MPSRFVSSFTDESDPITRALAPPPNETPAQREARLLADKKAKEVSDSIDEELNEQRMAERRAPKALKVLLLGQSESGKSTTLKNFQLMYEPRAFRAERASWRAVIQLNVVRSIHLILDAMADAQAKEHSPFPAPPSPVANRPSSKSAPQLTTDHLKLKLRLAPLLQVEEVLTQRLMNSGAHEYEATPFASPLSSERSKRCANEVTVNSTWQWKGIFSRMSTDARNSFDSDELIDWDNPNDPGIMLQACREDMIKLWKDPTIKELLEARNLRLEEMAGFFLDSLDRVACLRYVPTDDDVLRARLKTLGVSEHRFKVTPWAPTGASSTWEGIDPWWRAAWAPYFEDIDAIIFLAPISCFDQVLEEDRQINRLEDSVNLWTSVVSNPLLQNTNLVLFLNKCDILKAKLASGLRMSKYVVSYGDRPNNFQSASTYLRKKFAAILKERSPVPRVFYCHFTSVTDIKPTTYILTNLEDMLMRYNLQRSTLM